MDYTEDSSVVYDELGRPYHDFILRYDDPEVMLKPWLQNAEFIPVVLIYSLCFVFGSIGNALVIWAMQFDRRSRTVTATFLVSVAVADILMLLSAIPEVASYFARSAQAGNISCKMDNFCRMLSAFSAVLNLMAMMVERYVVIVHPMRSRQLWTAKNSLRALVGVWILAFLMASPSLYTYEVETFRYAKFNKTILISNSIVDIHLCQEKNFEDYSALYRLAFLFVLPLVAQCWCYGRMIIALWMSTTASYLVTHSGGGGGRPRRMSRSPGITPDGHRNYDDNPLRTVLVDLPIRRHDSLLEVPQGHTEPRLSNGTVSTGHVAKKYRRSRTESLAYTECPHQHPTARGQKALNITVSWKKPNGDKKYCSTTSLADPAKAHGTDLKAGRRQVIKMLLAISVAFFICWGPAVIFEVLRLYGAVTIGGFALGLMHAVRTLPYAHCCFNPIIYGFMSKNFRNSLRKTCMITKSLSQSRNDLTAKTAGFAHDFSVGSSPRIHRKRRDASPK